MDCRFRHSKHILKNLHPLIFIGMDKIRHRRPVFRKRHPRFNVSHGCQIIKNTWLCLNQRKAEKSHGCQILENTWLCLKQRKVKKNQGCQISENIWLCLKHRKAEKTHGCQILENTRLVLKLKKAPSQDHQLLGFPAQILSEIRVRNTDQGFRPLPDRAVL